MRKRFLAASLLVAFFSIALSACGNNAPAAEPVHPYQGRIKEKRLKVLNISNELQDSNDPRYYEEAKDITTYEKPDTYTLYYLDQLDDVYYLPLSSYVDLYKGDFKDGVINSVSENQGVSVWTSTLGEKTFTLTLDKNNQTLSAFGSLDGYFKPIPGPRNGVEDQMEENITYVEGHEEKTKTFQFGKYGFDVFEADGKTCYPLGLLAAELSKSVTRKFLCVSSRDYLLEYASAGQIEELPVRYNGQERSIKEIVHGAYAESFGVQDAEGFTNILMPATLAEFNKKIIYYVFDNYYGLSSVKKIKSMSDYFENLEVSSKFLSPKGTERGSAYSYAIQGLNDLHSSYGYSSVFFETADSSSINPQSLYNDRITLLRYLGTVRQQAIKKYNEENSSELAATNVRYSKDGKYAYFSFDQFETYTYYGEGEIPQETLLADCYHLFVKNLNEIKAKGTVERVFIDDSQNGGGYVDLMGKLLALMSKDNRSKMYLRDEGDDSIREVTVSVDSNQDGVYDEKDVFGNDFEFYIVTSNFSFSCGNAFPFYADQLGYAKVVGSKSGGGECCVFSHSLTSGQAIGYSSPWHIGFYDKETKTFRGDEYGTNPWLHFDESFNLYDVDSIGAAVTAKKPFAA